MPRLGGLRGMICGAAAMAVALTLGVSSAGAVTIGQLAPDVPPEESCFGGPFDLLQPTVTSGNGYVVPSTAGVTNWTLTSWSTNNRGMAGDTMGLKVFRKVGIPDIYKVLGHEGPHPLTVGINTFSAQLQVQAGDVLGAHSGGGDCAFSAPDSILFLEDSDLPDGGQDAFNSDVPFRLNETAEVTPVNEFTLAGVKAKKNGTAVVTLTLPNPGDLVVSGTGLKGSVSAVGATTVNAGTVRVVIRAKGKKKRKLAQKGKVKVTPTISYTPTGGSANSQTTKVKLRRK